MNINKPNNIFLAHFGTDTASQISEITKDWGLFLAFLDLN